MGIWRDLATKMYTIYTSEILLTPPLESELMFFRYCNLLYVCHFSCLEAISLCIIQSVHFNGKDIQQQPYRIRAKDYLGPAMWFLFYINTMYVILPCLFPQDYHCPPKVSPTPLQKWWREWVLVQWLGCPWWCHVCERVLNHERLTCLWYFSN